MLILGDYYDFYMEMDVIFLIDVFENFRKLCFNIYGLDLVNFYIVLGFVW